MERNSFVFYDSFYKAISKLKPEEQSLCLKALCDYCFKGESPKEDNPIVNMFFELIKPQIDTNNKRYENGCKGGRPKNQIITKVKPTDNQTKTKIEKLKPNDNVNDNDNDNVNVNDNENVNENVKKEKEIVKEKEAKPPHPKFQKPTKQDLQTFAIQEKLSTDYIDDFWDYYQSNGWVIGKGNPMKDWKSAYRRWCRNAFDKPKNKSSSNEFLEMLKEEGGDVNIFPQEDVVDVEGVEE